jgi:hypothetical protein
MGSFSTAIQPSYPQAKAFASPFPQPAQPGLLSGYSTSQTNHQSPQDRIILNQALTLLAQIRNLPQDEAYINHLGIQPGFRNGQQALQVIQNKGIRVEFGDMGDSPAHAQWVADQNVIMINQKYRNDSNPATLYAISEAIYHEAGHAAGNGDSESSVQEELNCLALNTLAHRFHTATDPNYANSVSNNRLLWDGVALYTRLFFDPDPQKQKLVNRVVEKYGDLPLTSPGHETPSNPTQPWPMAFRVKQQYNRQSPFQPSPSLPLPMPLPSGPQGGNVPLAGSGNRLSLQA